MVVCYSGRQGPACAKKVKNNMLAAVLVLTVIPNWVTVGRAVVEHCCFLITQKLLEEDEVRICPMPVINGMLTIEQSVTLTAAHCSKTLIVASSAGSPVLRECTKQLLPGLVEFIAKMVNSGTIGEARVAAIGEVWKAFSTFLSSIPENQRTSVIEVLSSLPTSVQVLASSEFSYLQCPSS